MCAFAIGTARDWLFRSRELIEARSFAPSGKTIDGAAAMAGERETKLTLGEVKPGLSRAVRVLGVIFGSGCLANTTIVINSALCA